MKNIYDIRKDEKLLYVLQTEDSKEKNYILKTKKVVIIINLYYLETVDRYISYIDRISEGVPIYIYSSRQKILEEVKRKTIKKDVYYNIKENRGRDISALLVAAKDVIKKYDYICFVHDKKANAKHLEDDAEFWIKNLWDNTLASKAYVMNVLDVFLKNREIGLLVPPEPYGEYFTTWYDRETWKNNFNNVKSLEKSLELKSNIDEDKPVFGLGTVFWARREALDKLFNTDWKYEDFQEEPLPIDGTLSHAIERILGYVAQDAGYKVGTIMTDRYATELLLRAQDDMKTMFSCLKERDYVQNMHQIKNLSERDENIKEFVNKFSKVYIYGAGNYGKIMSDILKVAHVDFEGYIVSQGNRKTDLYENKRVYEIQEISPDDADGIFIAVSYQFRLEVELMLKKYGFKNYFYIF